MSPIEQAGDFAHSPPITGEDTIGILPTMSVFREAIDKLYDPEASCSLLSVSIDNFTCHDGGTGKAMSDDVCVSLGERLRNLGGSDLLGRVGRENFIVFNKGASGRHLAHAIVGEARAPITPGYNGSTSDPISLTVSVGVALGPQHGDNLSDLYRSAQHAAARAKAAGGDRAQTSLLRLLEPGEVLPASHQLAATVRELIEVLNTNDQAKDWIRNLVGAYEAARTGGRQEFLKLGEMQFATAAPAALTQNAMCRRLQQRIEDLSLVLSRRASV